MNNKAVIGIVSLILVLGAVMLYLQHSPVTDPSIATQPPQPPAPVIAPAVLQQAWPTLIKQAASPTPYGNPKAKYTVIEIGDFQCPSCGKAEPMVMSALDNSNGKAKLYFYNWPLPQVHPHAMIAAQAGLSAAAQGKFWPMYKMLYGDQDSLIDSQIEFNARAIPGLNDQKLIDDLTKGTYIPTIAQESSFLESIHGFDSVPIVLVRGPKGNISVYEGAAPTAKNLTYPGINQLQANPPWARF